VSSLRRGLVAAVVVAAVSVLSACADAQNTSIQNTDYAPVTDVQYAPVNGVNADSTLVKVRNLYALGALGALPVRLRMTLVNTTDTDDALIGATLGTPAVSGRLIGGRLGALPVVRSTTVAVGAAGQPQVTFRGSTAKAGTWVPVTLLFRNGRAVATSVLVQNPVSLYSDGTVPTGNPTAPVKVVVVVPKPSTPATAAGPTPSATTTAS
jgi:hypothetical protein